MPPTSTPPRRLVAAAILGLSLLLGAGACQVSVGSDGLDIERLEGEVGRGIEQQTGIQVASVDCPGDVPMQEGHTFTCEVTAEDGSTAQVEVVQDDDQGNVTWELVTS